MSKDDHEKLLDFDKILAIVWKNWLVLRRDPIRLFPMIAFPLIMITLFGFATTGSPRGLPAAIVDYDHGASAAAVELALRSVNTISLRYEVGSEGEGRRLMDRGDIKALIIIPQGFSEAIATGREPGRVIVQVDESDPSVAGFARAALQSAVNQLSYSEAVRKVTELDQLLKRSSLAMQARSGDIQSISTQLQAGQYGLEQDTRTLNRVISTLKRDSDAANRQRQSLSNQLNVIQSADTYVNFFSGGLLSASAMGGITTSAQDLQVQIQATSARMAQDQQLIGLATQLLSANLARETSNQAATGSAQSSADSLSDASGQARASAEVSVITRPIQYVDQPAYGEGRKNIDFSLPNIIALVIFQGATMGMGRALAGEKRDGSLTRVFLTPTSNATILVGTLLFYLILETFRSSFLVFTAMLLFGVTLKGALLDALIIIGLFSAGSVGVGLLISAMTNSQDQYQAVSLLVSLPMMWLAGVFFPIETMPEILQSVAGILPISYAATALRGVMIKGFELGVVAPQLFILMAFAVCTVGLSLIVFKREIV